MQFMHKYLGSYFTKNLLQHTLFRDLLLTFSLIAFVLSRYYSVTTNFWLNDDPQILLSAIKYHPWKYFSSPIVWQTLSASNLTPWVSLSFALDWNIFGLTPRYFYLHQLVSLCAVSITAYTVLRLWFSSIFSFLGVLLFIASPVLAEAVQSLMVRHYIEGLLFALLSIYFFVIASRSNTPWLTILSSFFYLLSCSAKEIYVPLIFVLFLLHKGTFQNRLRQTLPLLAVTIAYIFWRWYMLGRLSGGYSLPLSLQDATLFFPRVADAMNIGLEAHLKLWGRLIVLATSLSALAILFTIDKKLLIIISVVLLIVLLPIIPVSPGMASRYVLLFSFCWAVLHIAAWDRLLKKWDFLPTWGISIIWGTILVSIFIFTSSDRLASLQKIADQQGKEGIFFLEKGTKSDLLINPASPGWYFDGLSWLRAQALHLPEGPEVNSDSRLLCLENQLHKVHDRIWYYDPVKRDMISEPSKEYFDRLCSKELLRSVQSNSPLFIKISYNNTEIFWEFGPYENGAYVLFFGNAFESLFELPAKGNRYVRLNDTSYNVRLRYSSPDGWVTYSPPLQLNISEQKGTLSWKK